MTPLRHLQFIVTSSSQRSMSISLSLEDDLCSYTVRTSSSFFTLFSHKYHCSISLDPPYQNITTTNLVVTYCANGHVWMTGDSHCFSEEEDNKP
jgi:hypothetical protein